MFVRRCFPKVSKGSSTRLGGEEAAHGLHVISSPSLAQPMGFFPQKGNAVPHCAAFPRCRCRELRTCFLFEPFATGTGLAAPGREPEAQPGLAAQRLNAGILLFLLSWSLSRDSTITTGKLLKKKQAPFFMSYK